MRLSVIVPIYKVEDSLDRCVSSIVAQNCPATEIILVDDGSPDSCPDICDQWERRNASIRVIHKANGGLSDARNAGIQVAKGDYITFVDSDDYLSPDTYTPLMEMLESMPEADMLEYSISIDNESHSLPLTMPDNLQETTFDAAEYGSSMWIGYQFVNPDTGETVDLPSGGDVSDVYMTMSEYGMGALVGYADADGAIPFIWEQDGAAELSLWTRHDGTLSATSYSDEAVGEGSPLWLALRTPEGVLWMY